MPTFQSYNFPCSSSRNPPSLLQISLFFQFQFHPLLRNLFWSTLIFRFLYNSWGPNHNHNETLFYTKWCNCFGKQFNSSLKRVTIWSSNSTPRYIPKRNENICPHKMFTATLFITVKKWKQPKYLTTDEWMNKMCLIHTMKYYSTTKSNGIFTYNMDKLEPLCLMKDKELYMIPFIW